MTALNPILGAFALALLGCGSGLPRPPYAMHPTSALVEVDFPPPPGRPESVPPQPTSEAVWIDGGWTWRRKKWAWSPGRWVVAPSASTYSPWTSVYRDDGKLLFAPGTWRNARGEDIPAPKALAAAVALSGVIFNAYGEVETTGRDVDPDRTPRRRRGDGGT